MRGADSEQTAMFSYVLPEQRVPQDHPLRPIRKMVDEARADALASVGQALFVDEPGVDSAGKTLARAAAAMLL